MSAPVTVTVHRAQSMEVLEMIPITIAISDPLPSEVSGNDLRAMFLRDAFKLVDALLHSLPGGTVDQLTIMLLERKISVLRLPYEIIPPMEIAEAAERDDLLPPDNGMKGSL